MVLEQLLVHAVSSSTGTTQGGRHAIITAIKLAKLLVATASRLLVGLRAMLRSMQPGFWSILTAAYLLTDPSTYQRYPGQSNINTVPTAIPAPLLCPNATVDCPVDSTQCTGTYLEVDAQQFLPLPTFRQWDINPFL